MRTKLTRSRMVKFFKSQPPTVVGIEACGESHHWAQLLGSFRHMVKLLAPHLVKPYVKRGKNDAADPLEMSGHLQQLDDLSWFRRVGRVVAWIAAVCGDNLGSHKGQALRTAIRETGAKLLFLAPYSPDLNPIEQVIAKLKTLLRRAEERSVEATWKRIGSLLDAFNPAECANYLRNSGYASI